MFGHRTGTCGFYSGLGNTRTVCIRAPCGCHIWAWEYLNDQSCWAVRGPMRLVSAPSGYIYQVKTGHIGDRTPPQDSLRAFTFFFVGRPYMKIVHFQLSVTGNKAPVRVNFQPLEIRRQYGSKHLRNIVRAYTACRVITHGFSQFRSLWGPELPWSSRNKTSNATVSWDLHMVSD